MSLYESTRELHHACEQHAIGQAMVNGTVTSQQWADWLSAFRTLHAVIDATLPDAMNRDKLLKDDLSKLPEARKLNAPYRLIGELDTEAKLAGAAYVLHGAHRRGGQYLLKKMSETGLPASHVIYEDPSSVEHWIRSIRGREDLTEGATLAFQCMLDTMDEIYAYDHLNNKN
jgi:heme oxygenase